MDIKTILANVIDDHFWQLQALRYQYDATGLAFALRREHNLEEDIDWLSIALVLINGPRKEEVVEPAKNIIPEAPSS